MKISISILILIFINFCFVIQASDHRLTRLRSGAIRRGHLNGPAQARQEVLAQTNQEEDIPPVVPASAELHAAYLAMIAGRTNHAVAPVVIDPVRARAVAADLERARVAHARMVAQQAEQAAQDVRDREREQELRIRVAQEQIRINRQRQQDERARCDQEVADLFNDPDLSPADAVTHMILRQDQINEQRASVAAALKAHDDKVALAEEAKQKAKDGGIPGPQGVLDKKSFIEHPAFIAVSAMVGVSVGLLLLDWVVNGEDSVIAYFFPIERVQGSQSAE